MRFLQYIILFSIFTTSTVVFAAENSVDNGLSMKTSRSIEVMAEVKTIDNETREVTLVAENGGEYSFIADEKTRNLDQVKVGDKVAAGYEHSIEITLLDGADVPAGEGEMDMLARRKEGEKPGVEAVKTKIQILLVSEINLEANTFKLRNKEGVENEFVARDPKKLKRAAVGDRVMIKDTRTLVLKVDEVTNNEPKGTD